MVACAFAADDPFTGTWKLTKGGGNPPPRSLIYKIEAQGNIHNMVTDRVDAEGKSTRSEVTRMIDGKDHPSNNPQYDSVRNTRIDPNTVLNEAIKEGKVVATLTAVVSKDGKTMTLTAKRKDDRGKDIESVSTYKKQ
jgi:hypothetical protein